MRVMKMNRADRLSNRHLKVTAIKRSQATVNPVADFVRRLCHLGSGFYTGLALLITCAIIASASFGHNIGISKQTPPSVVYRYSLNPKSSYFAAGIKDPYHPQEYIKQLAGKLGEEGARKLLLEGLSVSPPTPGGPKDAYISATIEPGPRDFTEKLQEALSQAGPVESLDRTAQFKANDGKDPLWQGEKAAEQAAKTIIEISDGLYSAADLIALDYLPDLQKEPYQDSAPIARPVIFTVRSIGSAWKTFEYTCNIPTLGYFDNLTGPAGIYIEDLVRGSERNRTRHGAMR